MWYKKYYENSLRMIRTLNIKNEREYKKLLKDFKVLSSESLKNIMRTRRFKIILNQIKEV